MALAGYDACHDLAASLVTAELGIESDAEILVAGASIHAQEVTKAGVMGITGNLLRVIHQHQCRIASENESPGLEWRTGRK